VLEVHDHEPLEPGQLQVHLVELRKVPAAGSPERASEGKLGDWARFFKAVDEAELQELAMTDPIFDKAKKELERLSADDDVRLRARRREDQLRMFEMQMFEAEMKGKAEGKAQDVLTVLQERGLHVPDHVRDRVLGCNDLGLLSLWLKRAVSCASAEEAISERGV